MQDLKSNWELSLPKISEEKFVKDPAEFVLVARHPGSGYSKMDADERGSRIVLGGNSKVCVSSISLHDEYTLEKEFEQMKVMELIWDTKEIVLQESLTNNLLSIHTESFHVKKLEQGYPREGSAEYEQIQSRHSGDSGLMVWARGEACLSSFSLIDHYIENVKMFWETQAVEEGDPEIRLWPIIAVSDQICSKYFGVGYDKDNLGGVPNQVFIVYYNESTQDIMHIPSEDFKKQINNWKSLDISADGNVVFVGGDKDGKGVVGAVSFDSDMKILKFITVDPEKGRAKSVTQLRRFTGTDLLTAGCNGLLLVYSYTLKQFTPLRVFEISDCKDITQIRIKHDKIIILDREGTIFIRRAEGVLDNMAAKLKGR